MSRLKFKASKTVVGHRGSLMSQRLLNGMSHLSG